MKAKSHAFRTADAFALGVLVTLAGCASSPTRHATGDALYTPAFSASGDTHVQAPVPVRTVNPIYPFEMRRDGVDGIVNVNCLIDENGAVREAIARESTDRRLVEPAVEAVKKWTFKPGLHGGVPAPTWVNIPIRFSLGDQ